MGVFPSLKCQKFKNRFVYVKSFIVIKSQAINFKLLFVIFLNIAGNETLF